jgi:hypothetical protein
MLPPDDKLWKSCCVSIRPLAKHQLDENFNHPAAAPQDFIELVETDADRDQLPPLLPPTVTEAVAKGWATPLNQLNKDDGEKARHSKHYCSLCRLNFAGPAAAEAHMRAKHPPPNGGKADFEAAEPRHYYTCFVCQKQFRSQASKINHVVGSHVAPSSSPLKRTWSHAAGGPGGGDRQEQQNEDGGGGSCGQCGKYYSGAWREHLEDCWRTLYYCTTCPSISLYK